MKLETAFLHALNLVPGIGPATLRSLRKYCGTYEAAWKAPESLLREHTKMSGAAVSALLKTRTTLHPEQELEKVTKQDIRIIDESDPAYPALLFEIASPPAVLYCRGLLPAERMSGEPIMVGMVGTRRPTGYGLDAATLLVRELTDAGIGIASGLAVGIDTISHQTTLAAGGYTVAVLGSGIDERSIFPSQNRGLARRIVAEGGAILSEYTPGSSARKEYFPQRNRIIAGISRGVAVVEARERSGALITTRFALESNRDVFAVPGPIFSMTSAGPNKLIQEGAALVTSGIEILDALGITPATAAAIIEKQGVEGNEEERLLLTLLEEPLTIDLLKQKTRWETGAIMATLSLLELKGLIRNCGDDSFQTLR